MTTRSDYCRYCQTSGGDSVAKIDGIELSLDMFERRSQLVISYVGSCGCVHGYASIGIDYCPWCGRRLANRRGKQ